MKTRVKSLFLIAALALSLLGGGVQTAQAASRAAGSGRPYYIMVNRTMNTVTVYGLDENGAYTVPVKAMVCSVGRRGSVTPRGTFSIGSRRAWCRMVDGSYGQYATQFYGSYLFHSVCYSAADPSTLLTYEYNMLGGPASLGCVRLQTCDAKWIYDHCAAGTRVTVYDDASPGPLGKPDKAVEEITPEMDNGWDPTDPREDNPWRSLLVSGISLDRAQASLTAGESLLLTPTLTPSTAMAPKAVWRSSDPSVACVDAGGRVTGLSAGDAVITLSCGEVSDSCAVRVEKTLLPLADVPPGVWYYGDVRYVYEAGVMRGTSDSAFSPEAPVSYAVAVEDICRLPDGEGAQQPDAGGAGDAEPDPQRPLARQELAVLLYEHETRRYGRPEGGFASLSRFADGGEVEDGALEAVGWAVSSGLLQGAGHDTLDPRGTVSRAQEAAILHRYLQYHQSGLQEDLDVEAF